MNIIHAITSINYKDVVARAAWTFLQAFLAVFLVVGVDIINLLFSAGWKELMALLIATSVAAAAAGISAVKTVVLETYREIKRRAEGNL